MHSLNFSKFYQSRFRIEVLLRLPDFGIEIDIQSFTCLVVITVNFRLPANPGEVIQLGISRNLNPPVRFADISLRLGHATALTCHRQVIHFRGAASLPLELPRGSVI